MTAFIKTARMCKFLGLCVLLLTGCTADGGLDPTLGGILRGVEQAGLSSAQIEAGLREALRVGTDRAVGKVGAQNGYFSDPQIRVPLPTTLAQVDDALARVGANQLTEDLRLRLNRAAEAAAQQARAIFVGAIQQMTLSDVQAIFNGPDDAATRFFERTTSGQIRNAMRPIITDALNQVGAIRALDQALSRYNALPFVPNVTADLTDHTLNYGMRGLFTYLAREEADIRRNPAARTTAILRQVFGG